MIITGWPETDSKIAFDGRIPNGFIVNRKRKGLPKFWNYLSIAATNEIKLRWREKINKTQFGNKALACAPVHKCYHIRQKHEQTWVNINMEPGK